ncbi:hypothetical protein [Lentisalinibacter sediminis]|uniref:hypothetical protein n=1 Tax=Lentisalinibacter sediminis TaxID=2992237 RepID=UPI00386EAA7B
MNLKQNPFSVYDFLGYFTPGALGLYTLFLLEPHAAANLKLKAPDGRSLIFDDPQLFVPFVLFAYGLGHVLSYLSSVIVEKYSIWSLGYPSKYLLGLRVYGFWEVGKDKGRGLRFLSRFVFGLILAPIALFDAVFLRLFSGKSMIGRPLDPLLTRIIMRNVGTLLREKSGVRNLDDYGTPVATDYFRFAYHFAVENCPRHLAKMQNYVALYGFLRTLTLIAALFWWLVVVHLALTGLSLELAATAAVLTALVLVFYLAFVKFYRRFNLEVYMAVSTCGAVNPDPI